MTKVSFEGIGAVVATFACGPEVLDGQVVKLSGNAAVEACTAGERFCGVALSTRDGYAGVQVEGLATVSVTGTVGPGWSKLSADGNGGVKADTAGTEFLVVAADETTAVVRL